MKSSIVRTLILWSILTAEIHGGSLVDRSVSPSGQFVIYGGDAAWRGTISTLGERAKTNLLSALRRHDHWTTCAVINLEERAVNTPEVPNVALRFSQTGVGLKLQLDLAISPEMRANLVEREILRVILLEMIYRNQTSIAAGETYVQPPDWLIDGLLALGPSHDRASLVDALAASGQVPPLVEFLKQRVELLDSVGRSLYRAYSFALVQWLAEDPDRLGGYIDNLACTANDPLADLQKSFPRLAGGNLENSWRSRVAGIRYLAEREILNFSQSNKKLGALLEQKFPASSGRNGSLSFDELCNRKLTPKQCLALGKFSQELMLLTTVANPALRPLVEKYQELATVLAIGKNRGVATSLKDLNILRAKLSARMTEIDDYMNWFEATQLQTSSGAFENFKPLTGPGTRPRRGDSFSIYLDAMEAQF